ncbi:MAG: type II secretion system F family protein [Candidatus Moranbacteria bacterium]|nr:type II secretion system F family protein [Candidatus Moranbacteria bacterium]
MKFLFKAKNDAGQIREGLVEAINWETAAQILEKNGLIPITVQEQKSSMLFMKSFQKLLEGVSQKELMTFFRQLATLIEARVPITSALHTIGEQMENKYLRIIVKEVEDTIGDGMPFSEALAKHPDVFSPLTVNMIRSGEASGSLQKAIVFVAENIEKSYQLTSKIKSAFYYPIFVFSVAFIVGFLVVTFILPKITALIKDMNIPIPWYTAFLVWLGDFMNQYWWAVLLVIVAGVGTFVYYIRTEAGRYEWQVILLKIPVIGTLARNIYITRFADNLSALLGGGIPVVRALSIVSEVIGNHVFRKIILRAAEEVRAGGTMSTVFLQTKEIPPIVSQMVRIGEETGLLSQVLKKTGDFYSQEVELTTKNLTTLIEPILIVLLGIGVAILVVGVLLPIYNIAGQL